MEKPQGASVREDGLGTTVTKTRAQELALPTTRTRVTGQPSHRSEAGPLEFACWLA